MAYELREGEALGAGLARILVAQVNEAISALSDVEAEDQHEIVHRARKRMRTLRAFLKLARPAWPEDDFRRENQFFRDAARVLSPARDAFVLIGAFDAVVADAGSDRTARVRKRLVRGADGALEEARSEPVRQELVARLEDGRRRMPDWPQADEADVWEGFRAAYKRMRRAWQRAHDEETRHEWRKRVKDVRYQVRFLQPLWPDTLGPLETGLHQLTDTLGEEHDLVILADTVRRRDLPAALWTRIDERRAELQRNGHTLALRLHGEKPRSFAERLHGYHQAWRRGVVAP